MQCNAYIWNTNGGDFAQAIAHSSIHEKVAPRTPNYNFSAPDHHWLIRHQRPLTKDEALHIDALYQSRLKTLISVDDLVEDLIRKLRHLQVMKNTYVIFTSDNGFHMGEFRLPENKLQPYETDIRVPMMIRGPGITKNSKSSLLSSHVNLMPTLLGIATRQYSSQDVVPSTMDGTNLAANILDSIYEEDDVDVSVFASATEDGVESCLRPSVQFSSVLVEYTSVGDVVRYNHLVDTYNHSFVALRILDDRHNLKYVEFRDCRRDWDMTGSPLEQELYDLNHDRFELDNMVNRVSHMCLKGLASKVQRMIQCRGDACRREHSMGVNFCYLWLVVIR